MRKQTLDDYRHSAGKGLANETCTPGDEFASSRKRRTGVKNDNLLLRLNVEHEMETVEKETQELHTLAHSVTGLDHAYVIQ